MIVPSRLALKTHTNFGYTASLATLDKLQQADFHYSQQRHLSAILVSLLLLVKIRKISEVADLWW
jgi:hypothetical protein